MRLVFAGLFAASALAQVVTLGVKGGIRTTNDLEGSGTSESKPYLVGPMAELRLPWHFSFEADALYSRFGYTSAQSNFAGTNDQRARANSWESPLLAKYRFAIRGVRPYALLGYAPRHISGDFVDSGFSVDFYTGLRSPYRFSGTSDYVTDHAAVAGAGIDFVTGHIHVAPELRYLRWKNPPYSVYSSQGYYLLVPQNEVQILVGIGWGGR
jgi:hypothetical protein